ncbi:MAG: zf-HC2 domain-containing protein [Candidatus Zixiibacteriota bacterium]
MADCENKLKSLLPWYLNRTLSAEEAKKVEAHLKECPKCQKELEELRWLSSGVKEHKEVFASPHIESGKLVIFFEEAETLATEERTTIERHLQSCPLCHEELQTLKRANLELAALEKKEEPKFVKEASVWERISERLTWLVRKPAFAYIIVVLLAYPAGRWLFSPSQPGMPPVPKVACERVYVLSEQTRVTAEPISVFRSSEDKEVRVGIPFWTDLDNHSYDLRINDESGQTIFTVKDFTDFGDQGFFQLLLNTDSIPDGRYNLILRETNKRDPATFSETYFPFQITKAKE